MLRVCTSCPCRQSTMSYSVAIMCGRCLPQPQSEDPPGIGDERTSINNVVVVYGCDRYGGGVDFSDGNGNNSNVGHRGWNL